MRIGTQFEAEDVSHERAPLHYRKEAGDYMHRLVDLTGPSLQEPTADQFILRAPVKEDLLSPGSASLQVTSFFVDAQKVVADFTVSKPGFVRIPFGWFPWHTIRLDGGRATAYPDAMNMICRSRRCSGLSSPPGRSVDLACAKDRCLDHRSRASWCLLPSLRQTETFGEGKSARAARIGHFLLHTSLL